MSKLLTVWTSHLKTEEEKKSFRSQLSNTSAVFTRLRDILREGEKLQDDRFCSDKFFENPNWPNAMAFELGKKSYAKHVLKLLSFLDP